MIGSQRCNEAATYAARLATIGSFWENPSIYFLLQQHQGCLAVAGSLWWAGAAGAPLSTRSGAGWVAPARPVLELRHQNCPIQRGPTSKTASLDDRSSIPSSPSKRPHLPLSHVSQGHRALGRSSPFRGTSRCRSEDNLCATGSARARARGRALRSVLGAELGTGRGVD